ncbi:MAG: peptide ABC transporter substrate-binding protein [Gammaproteobacteria bacterium]|nr:peptide ABC transporter substrate-binding protein [Gammaproteobacteria bacterium]NNC76669.1 peptide ABC transporter substrate-binding protein [Woeseiaceae bacterium]
MFTRRSLASLVTFLAVGAGIIACERAEQPDSDAAPQRIVRGNGGAPGSLDPALAEDIHAFNILIDTFEGLLTEDARGRRVAGAAESWTTSNDGRVYSFRLRSGLRWSNGDELTAADFVRGLRRVAAPATGSSYAFLLGDIENFEDVVAGRAPPDQLGITAISPYELEIRLTRPTDNLLAVLTQAIAFPVHASGDTSIGNGAYTLAERETDGTILLRKNRLFREAGQVKVDEIIYVPVTDPVSEYNAYRSGEIDITNTIPGQIFAGIREQHPDETHVSPMLALYYLAFDLSEEPFDDPMLRRALTMAIDRHKLTRLIGRGEQPACGIVPPGVDGHENAVYDWCTESRDSVRDAARAAYAEAGYTAESPLEIRYVYDAGDPLHERVALAVAAMWQDELGVRTNLEKREWMYFLETRTRRKDWDVMRFAWFGDYNGAHTFLDIFYAGSEQNLPAYRDATYDELLRDSQTSTGAIERHLIENYPIAPLYFFVGKHLVKPHIKGFESNVMDRHPSRYLSID